MHRLWPTGRQWKSWSLPSQITFIGGLASVVGLLLGIGYLFRPGSCGTTGGRQAETQEVGELRDLVDQHYLDITERLERLSDETIATLRGVDQSDKRELSSIRDLVSHHDLHLARMRLTSLKKKYQELATIPFLEADAFFKEGREQQALESFQLAVRLKPDFPEAWNNISLLLSALGNFEGSLAAIDSALTYCPASPVSRALYLTNRGSALSSLRRRALALADYDSSLAIGVDDRSHSLRAATWTNRGYLLGEMGAYAQASASLDSALNYPQAKADALAGQALISLYLKRYSEAVSFFNASLAVNPRNPVAWTNRAIPLLRLGQLSETIASADSALRYYPNLPAALLLRSVALADLGRPAEALRDIDRALAIASVDWPARPFALKVQADLREALRGL